MENSVNRFHASDDEIMTNARVKYYPDDNGNYIPVEVLAFEKKTFVPLGWEATEAGKPPKPSKKPEAVFEAIEENICSPDNLRKSYCRARNKLFDYLMCNPEFDCFITLTLDGTKIDRTNYDVVVKKLGEWLSNKVQRHNLKYVLVPEFHKDGHGIHFHGLCNSEALSLRRAVNPYIDEYMCDKNGRKIYNAVDYPLGFSTVIELSGENCRERCGKYVYKYINKSGGEKVGGRYYLSGGALRSPRFEYVDVDFDSLQSPVLTVGGVKCKKLKLRSGEIFN